MGTDEMKRLKMGLRKTAGSASSVVEKGSRRYEQGWTWKKEKSSKKRVHFWGVLARQNGREYAATKLKDGPMQNTTNAKWGGRL